MDYLCIGGPCDGEFQNINHPVRHKQRVECTRNRELAIFEEIDPTALWATQERFIYEAHLWTDHTGKERFYLLPFDEQNPWNGFDMLDHLVSVAYPQAGITGRTKP